MKKLVSIVLLAVFAQIVSAQQADLNSNATGSWSFGGEVGFINIDSDVALQQGIEDSAYSVGIFANFVQSSWVTTSGLDVIVYDDNEEFKQAVIGDGLFNDGDVSVESSDASAVLISVATGYQWLFAEEQDIAVILQGGYGVVAASERAIDSCSDCFTEDIDVDGGLFVKASLLRSTKSFDFGVYAQQFLTGNGLSNSIGITLNFPL